MKAEIWETDELSSLFVLQIGPEHKGQALTVPG